VAEESITASLKRLERYIHNLQAARSLNTLKRDAREAVLKLRDSISAARVAQADAENEDDAREIILATEFSIKQLQIVEQSILDVSSYDLLSAADVAELTALTEHIRVRLHTRISQ